MSRGTPGYVLGQDFSFKDFVKLASQIGDHPENNLAKSGYLLN